MPTVKPKFGLKVTFTWEVGFHPDTVDLLRNDAREVFALDDVAMVTTAKVSEDPVVNFRRALDMMGDFKPRVIYLEASDASCAAIRAVSHTFKVPIVRVQRRVAIDTELLR